MKLSEYASIRTGLPLSRKETLPEKSHYKYNALSLKNVLESGYILLSEILPYYASEELKKEYFTHFGDVILRLSVPYTAILITEKETNLLVPSHFAIIRTNKTVDPRYLHWWLIKNRKSLYKNASGGTMMGTISSGYIEEMSFKPPPLEKQRKLAELFSLANREQQLLSLLWARKKQLTDAVLEKILMN